MKEPGEAALAVAKACREKWRSWDRRDSIAEVMRAPLVLNADQADDYIESVDDYLDRLIALEIEAAEERGAGRLAEATRLLREAEWEGQDREDLAIAPGCPWCGKPEDPGSHAPTCPLAAFLAQENSDGS